MPTTVMPTTVMPTTVMPTTIAPSAPLDTLSSTALAGLIFAYSVKRLLTSYIGPILNVRRSSDNTTLDFYADVYGNLGTELNGGGTPLSTWLDGSTGYVVIWYDQSGNGKNASQTTASLQPSIDVANKYVNFRNNTNSYFTQPDGSYSSGNSPYTVVWKQYTTSDSGFIHWQGTMGDNTALFTNTQSSNTTYRHAWWQSFYWDLAINATDNTMVYTYNGSGTVSCYKNGVSQGTASSGTRKTLATYAALGAMRTPSAVGSFLNGELYFVMSFQTALSETDRGIVEQLSGY